MQNYKDEVKRKVEYIIIQAGSVVRLFNLVTALFITYYNQVLSKQPWPQLSMKHLILYSFSSWHLLLEIMAEIALSFTSTSSVLNFLSPFLSSIICCQQYYSNWSRSHMLISNIINSLHNLKSIKYRSSMEQIPIKKQRNRRLLSEDQLRSQIRENENIAKQIPIKSPKKKKVEYIKSFIKYFEREYAKKIKTKTSRENRALWNTIRKNNHYNKSGLKKIFEQETSESSCYRQWIISQLTESQLKNICNQKHRNPASIQQFENKVNQYLQKLAEIQSKYKKQNEGNELEKKLDPISPTVKENQSLIQTSDKPELLQYPQDKLNFPEFQQYQLDSQLDSQENQYISQFLNLDEKLMIDKSKFD